MARQLGSQYLLDAPIGRGASGEVWRGSDRDGNPRAFKVLHEALVADPAVVQRFVQERTILTGLDHPNLVPVHDIVVEGNTVAIVMDLVSGGDLRAVLASYRTLPPAEVCRIGAEVAGGLTAVHAAGVVHRDLKPENVLLDPTVSPPTPKLTDFGIAKIAEQSSTGRTTMLVGTPTYLAPEIFDGQTPTPAADLYGLGVLLYELSCGVPPFVGSSALAVLRQHVEYLPGRPDGLPDPLWELIWGLLAKDPAGRLGPAARVANLLTALAHDLAGWPPAAPLTAPPPAVPATVHTHPTELVQSAPAAQRRRRTTRLVMAALAAAAVLVAGVTGWALARSGSDPITTSAESPTGPTAGAPATTRPALAPTSAPPATTAPPTPAPSPTPSTAVIDVLPRPPADPGVPFDSGTVTVFDSADLDDGASDLASTDEGLAAQNRAQVARWTGGGPPLPSDCHGIPNRDWLLFVPTSDLEVDDAFCLITAEGRYGYFEIRQRTVEEGALREITITFRVWANE